MPIKLAASEQYECLLVFLDIHSRGHESLLRIKSAEAASMGVEQFLSTSSTLNSGLSRTTSVPELA